MYIGQWKYLFSLDGLVNIDKPLTRDILKNPEHPVTQQILYIYTMESFIYPAVNRTCRNHDESQIRFYGAFAAALSYILYFANKNRRDNMII